MSRIAVVKPDHLGDLVLASPAIRAITHHYGEATLYVASGNFALSQFLFPGTDVRGVDFPHLCKRPDRPFDMDAVLKQLKAHELLFVLRDDAVMRDMAKRVKTEVEVINGRHLAHDTAIHKESVCRRIPNYSRTSLFSGEPIFWPGQLRHVALCIAAGYPTNRWPNTYWLELAMSLLERGIRITLVGGPAERPDLRLLSASLGKRPHQIVEGSSDFGAFFSAISEVDLVIASDGGTAHLCSLKKPVLSIFGSSPWRRYAPFGWNNIVITRNMPCSPCVQFSTEVINCCLTRECLAFIRPSHIIRVLESNGLDFSQVHGVKVSRGTSHIFEH